MAGCMDHLEAESAERKSIAMMEMSVGACPLDDKRDLPDDMLHRIDQPVLVVGMHVDEHLRVVPLERRSVSGMVPVGVCEDQRRRRQVPALGRLDYVRRELKR